MTKTPDFDFAEWFGGGDTPEESCDVYTATHLIGEINVLQRQIEEEDRVRDVEPTLADDMSPAEEQLAALFEEYLASRRTFYIRGLDQGERTTLRKQHDTSGSPDEDFPRRCLSASIVALRRPGGERTPTKLTLGAVVKLHRQLGDGQMAALFETYQRATSGVPHVDADFLRRRSGQENTEES